MKVCILFECIGLMSSYIGTYIDQETAIKRVKSQFPHSKYSEWTHGSNKDFKYIEISDQNSVIISIFRAELVEVQS